MWIGFIVASYASLFTFVWINSWMSEHFSFFFLWLSNKTGWYVFIFKIILEKHIDCVWFFTESSLHWSPFASDLNAIQTYKNFIILNLNCIFFERNRILRIFSQLINFLFTIWKPIYFISSRDIDSIINERSPFFLRLQNFNYLINCQLPFTNDN
jgi:hypothetical protein